MASSPKEIYLSAILEQGPRLLSLMDREPLGPTTGCCDRTYWAWKFVDFPGARYQEAACALAFLYATAEPSNRYYRNPGLLEWIGYALQFWRGLQHKDGSFDEAYPYERSLAATAFTSFYVAEALELLGKELPPEALTPTKETLIRAGRWLLRNEETHGFLTNHVAAAAAALYHVYRLTGDTPFERRSRYFNEQIFQRQSSEGWYEEYGGADPGYQTHGSFYLARCWQLSGDESIAASLERATDFLARFVHPDGSLGGEYTSRNTQTYYPAAFEMLQYRHGTAAWMVRQMRPSLGNARAAALRCIDAQNYFPFLNNYIFAYRACAHPSGPPVEPCEPADKDPLLWFPQAGMVRVRHPRYDAYVGTAKGGVIKVFDRVERRLVYSDCGYVGRLHDGRIASSQHFDPHRSAEVSRKRIHVEGDFCEVSRPVMGPLRFIAFRLFTLSAGRFAGLGRWLKNLLVKTLIYRKKPLRIRFKRTIQLDDSGLEVRDEIRGPDGGKVEQLMWGEAFTTIHMGSSRYFVMNQLDAMQIAEAEPSGAIDARRIASGIHLRRRVVFKSEPA